MTSNNPKPVSLMDQPEVKQTDAQNMENDQNGMVVSLGNKSRRSSAVFYFLRQQKFLYGLILLMALVSSAVESLTVVTFYPLLTSLVGGSQGEAAGVLGFVTRLAGLIPVSSPIAAAALLLAITVGFKSLITLLQSSLIAYGGFRAQYRVRKQTMEGYAQAQYQFHLSNRQGTMVYNLLSASSATRTVLIAGTQMVALLFKILAIAIVLFTISPAAASAIGIFGVVFYAMVHWLSARVSYSLGAKAAAAGVEQTVITNEFLSGFRQIITFGVSARWLQRFERENRIHNESLGKSEVFTTVPRPLMEVAVLALMLGFVLYLKISNPDAFVSNGIPTLGVFAVAMALLLPSLTGFSAARMAIMAHLPNLELVYDNITHATPRRKDGSIELKSFEQGITFENLSFAYSGRDPLFRDLNISFDKGKVTAVVGPSGSGKTSMINLILGLFEPTGGRIMVDGVSIDQLKQETWLNKIGFVSQDSFIYHETVAENIRFSRDEYDIDSVVAAAKIANAHDFISALPDGYDTMVGDRGMRLSGGEQQRVAIARAVLGEPEILIFDEATSSLDTISESAVQEAIHNVSANRTVIIIAHRLSTIRHADKIIVIDGGRVIEEGNHQELLHKNGHYTRLTAASN